MKIARYRQGGVVQWGAWTPDGIRPLPRHYATTAELLDDKKNWTSAEPGDPVAPNDVELLSPITENQQVIAQATNFRSHITEVGGDPNAKTTNAFFRKASSCLTGATSPIVKPDVVRLLDYELELGLVIGREITGPVEVTPENLPDYVAGLVMHNDVSAREHQVMDKQFHKAKSFRTFGPTGPYIQLLTPELAARIADIEFDLRVNGDLRQSSRLGGDMVHEPAPTLSELSNVMDLHPGDLIVTGTPAGVALRVPPKPVQLMAGLLSPAKRMHLFVSGQLKHGRFLQPGDRIEAQLRTPDGAIDLGAMRNEIVSDAA